MKNTLIGLLLFSAFGYKCQTGLDLVLNDYLKDNDLLHASYGICILDAKTGKLIKEYNSNLGLIPASTLKIVTTGAALGILKKNYNYKTHYSILYKGDSIANSTQTILKITGSSDPSFNSSYFYNNDSLFFSNLLTKLKKNNITKLHSIIVDNSCIDNSIPSNWIWGDIGNYFGSGANGLSYKDNKFSIFYNSGEINSKAKIESISPKYISKKIKIETDVLSYGTEDEAIVYGSPFDYNRKISGTIPANKKSYEVEAQMPEPEKYFTDDLKNALKHQTTFSEIDTLITDINSFKSKWIYTHTSPALDKIIYFTNLKSNNHYAESLLKTIGAFKSNKQGTTNNGIDEIEKYWESKGIDTKGLHMVDGSGLSRANTITTKIQAQILSKIFNDSLIYDSFNKSLPVAGKSGSMTNLCKDSFAENNMRAKTGYINRVRSYCGYVKTKSGKTLAFSVIFNNYDCSAKEMKLKIEKLLIKMADL